MADGQTESAPERNRRERPHREHVAVGEVDQLDDAVDERVADRDERPDGAVGESFQEVETEQREVVVNDLVPVDEARVPAGEVADSVVDRQRRERRDQTPHADVRAHDAERPRGRRSYGVSG